MSARRKRTLFDAVPAIEDDEFANYRDLEPKRRPSRAANVAPSRIGKDPVSAYLDPSFRRALKHVAADKELTQEALLAFGINMVLRFFGRKTIPYSSGQTTALNQDLIEITEIRQSQVQKLLDIAELRDRKTAATKQRLRDRDRRLEERKRKLMGEVVALEAPQIAGPNGERETERSPLAQLEFADAESDGGRDHGQPDE